MKREDSGIHTRKRIINSALNVAARAGFSSATTKEIASGAKCSEGIIYHYFRGKNELFFAVIKESAEMFLGELDLQLRLAKNAEAKLIQLIDFHFQYFTGKINIFQILFGKSADAIVPFPYILKTVILPYQQIIEGIIKEGIEGGEFRKVNHVLMASNLLGMMQFNIIKMHFRVSEMDMEDIKSVIKNLIFKTLLKTR